VETAVALIDRLVDRLVESDVPLQRNAITLAARKLLAEEAPLAGPELAVAVTDALVGLGPIEALLRDPGVSDVLVNGPDEIWVERFGRLERSSLRYQDSAAVVAAVERVIAPLGLRLDRASPSVDARLADGSRLHAVVPPVSVDGPIVAIRRFTAAVTDLESLVVDGALPSEGAEMLAKAVRERRNVLIAGGTGTGKTTLLNVLSGEIPPGERVVTIEDAAELQMSGHVVRLEARPANAEGAGEITLQQLVRSGLRLRPDRIILGEVRGPEALDLVSALNTGHQGSMSTVHANSPEEALWRIETLALSGDRRVSEPTVRRQLMSAVDLVVQMVRRGEQRRVCTLARIDADGVREVASW
jgi:pilus assembly protein CpaF